MFWESEYLNSIARIVIRTSVIEDIGRSLKKLTSSITSVGIDHTVWWKARKNGVAKVEHTKVLFCFFVVFIEIINELRV